MADETSDQTPDQMPDWERRFRAPRVGLPDWARDRPDRAAVVATTGGVLEVHSGDLEDVRRAGAAILAGLGASADDQLRPHILYSDVIEDISDQHAVIVNRNRQASMVMPGQTLLVFEMTPALFATVAANAAEKVAPDVTLVDVSMIGAAGRLYMAGSTQDVLRARDEIARVLGEVQGREQVVANR